MRYEDSLELVDMGDLVSVGRKLTIVHPLLFRFDPFAKVLIGLLLSSVVMFLIEKSHTEQSWMVEER